MRRHVLVGRYGHADTIQVPAARDEVITSLDLTTGQARLDHGLGQALDDLDNLGLVPTESGLDVAVLAVLVHAADTRISRVSESQDTWTREIRLVVPVTDPARWCAAKQLVTQMLAFLTGDRWMLDFRNRPAGFAKVIRSLRAVHSDPPFDGVSLLSGGLDSLVGAIDLLESGEAPLLVSHAGDGAASTAQEECFQILKAHYALSRLERVRVWMSFPSNLVKGSLSESTTRARSFLFIALGVFAGTGLRVPFTLGVPENGLIALNVPLDPLRLGSLSTRTTHPYFLQCWNQLLEMMGIPGHVQNPFWAKTKGELVAACKNPALLKRATPTSISCASPTKGRWQGHGTEHCGYCLPCLIRRAALKAAWGPRGDQTTYTLTDLTSRALDTRKPEGHAVRSFQVALKRIATNPELAKVLVHKQGPLPPDPASREALAEVYRRGLAEVGSLLNGVQATPS